MLSLSILSHCAVVVYIFSNLHKYTFFGHDIGCHQHTSVRIIVTKTTYTCGIAPFYRTAFLYFFFSLFVRLKDNVHLHFFTHKHTFIYMLKSQNREPLPIRWYTCKHIHTTCLHLHKHHICVGSSKYVRPQPAFALALLVVFL